MSLFSVDLNRLGIHRVEMLFVEENIEQNKMIVDRPKHLDMDKELSTLHTRTTMFQLKSSHCTLVTWFIRFPHYSQLILILTPFVVWIT